MPSFEPSTWAEVEEAAATDKAESEHPFVANVRNFTQAPERFLTDRAPTPPKRPPEDRVSEASSAESLGRPRPLRAKRTDGQFDDLLGYGRVDLDTETFVRRHAGPVDDVSLPGDGVGAINPSCESFDAARYLAHVHRDSTEEQLRTGKTVLSLLRKRLDSQAEDFRSEKYLKAALVEAAFESTKRSLLPLSPFNGNGEERDTVQVFENAEAMLKERYEDVVRRETRLARLQRTLAIFKRYQWVFALGGRLRSAATEDVVAIEEAVREYVRGVKWLDAQDAAGMATIRRDVNEGFAILIDAIVARLSNAHSTRSDTSRLVIVLSTVKKEDLLADALAKRMAFAEEGLQKAVRSVDLAPMLNVRDGRRTEHDVADLVTRASNGFYEGLSHVWRLGRVLMGQDRWLRSVDAHIVKLCEAYAKILRDGLLSDVSLISRRAVKEIASVRAKAVSDLQVPETCLGPLEEVSLEIIESFLRSLSKAVRAGAEQIAAQSVQNDTVGTQAAQLLQALTIEALSQVDSSLFRGKEGLDERTSLTRIPDEDGPPSARMLDQTLSSVDLLGKTCAEAPAIFAAEVHDKMQKSSTELELASLKVAVCCTELTTGVLDSIADHTQAGSPFDARAIQRQLRASEQIIDEIQDKALTSYVTLVASPLQALAAGLVTFPEDELGDSVTRTVPIKIEGVSKSANELVLQLALITITTRKRSSNTMLIRHILLHLISEIGQTLVDVLSTDKLAYHRAAQLWVDVTYMQEMVTKGANAEGHGVQDALDGFSRVKERAVQAVLADGYSFSLADMQGLRESVVAGGMDEASMVCECFAETWGLLKAGEDED